jgi:excisionase family DNA binding protein
MNEPTIMNNKTPTVLTFEEVTTVLRIHKSTLYRLLKRRRIPAMKVGRDWRFNRQSLEKWINAGGDIRRSKPRPEGRDLQE